MTHLDCIPLEQSLRRSLNSFFLVASIISIGELSLSGTAFAQFGTFCEGGFWCPCSNPPVNYGPGCNNFGQHTGGAHLQASGQPSVTPPQDSLLFTSSLENNSSLSIFIQGTVWIHPTVVFGAGLRCVGGTLKRMYVGNAISGTIARPGPSDLDVATRSASPPGPLDPLSPGDVRYYFVYYRDPQAAGPCGNPNSTFNSTNAMWALWQL